MRFAAGGGMWRAWFMLLIGAGASCFARAREERIAQPCPGVKIIGESVDFTEVEKRLFCGDPQSDGWREIPWTQAAFHLRAFLQQRALLRPTFERDDSGVLVVHTGEATRVTALIAEGAPPELRIQRKRKVVGAELTPQLLDDVEKWVKQRLEAEGYACPEVETIADPETGIVRVRVRAGEQQALVQVDTEDLPGVEPGTLRRYDAFRFGERFNGDLLGVTETRVTQERVADATHFVPRCTDKGVVARQEVLAGPPRLLVFGVGVNTEGLVLGKANWRHSRLGRFASWTDLTLLGSAREQSANLTINWFFLDHPSRVSLRPVVEVRHQNEEHFETLSMRVQAGPATTWDNQHLSFYTLQFGPVFEAFKTYRGPQATDRRDTHFLSLGGEAKLRSHAYEFYIKSPRAGYLVTASAFVNQESVLSDATAERFRVFGEALWNDRDFDPPLLVAGLRGGMGLVVTPERPGLSNRLPPTFMQYLGGSNDLRGWGRQELPFSGEGALTSFYLGLELRLVQTLPWGLEPFAFSDVGALGREPLRIDSPIYGSPGFGMRWQSPIGAFRTTLARGFPWSQGHWQFYLSYGEEF